MTDNSLQSTPGKDRRYDNQESNERISKLSQISPIQQNTSTPDIHDLQFDEKKISEQLILKPLKNE